MQYHIKDPSLAPQGALRAGWAAQQMPVLRLIRGRLEKQGSLKGINIGACLHVTSETANLVEALQAAGAEVALCGSNPLSTQDEVAAYLVAERGIPVFAVRGEDQATYYQHIESVLATRPQITIDDGADFTSTLITKHAELAPQVIGGAEETTTGVIRLRSMEQAGVLGYPIIAVNDAQTKFMFDNRYGTGQSTIDGILRATNLLLAGKRFVVCGYGWCGRGLASRARGMGALVSVVEVNPLSALEAVMEGYQVLPLAEAARTGEVFVTVTGDTSVLREEHFAVMPDGAIMANSGHFDVEIDIPALTKMAASRRTLRPGVEEFLMPDGRRLYLLAEGRLVNLAAAEGHPAGVMDMSFANQALCAAYLAEHGRSLEKRVYPVPPQIDREVARLKLEAMGITIDVLTPEQEKYLSSWELGT